MDKDLSTEHLTDSLRIPTLPASILKLREMLAREDSGLADIAKLVANDPPIAAKALRIANSAQFGLREKTLSVHKASTVLGIKTLSTIAMRAGVVSVFEHVEDTPGFSLDAFWRHAILTAHTASELALRTRRRAEDLAPQDYYTCGLLHDIGKLVMYDSFGADYARTLLKSLPQGHETMNEEERFMGLNHAAVGALSASMWGLPEPIPQLIRFHHRPRECPRSRDISLLIACADEIAECVSKNPSAASHAIVTEVCPHLPGASPQVFLDVAEAARRCWDTIEL